MTHEVTAEIEALHVFFVQWFGGGIERDESLLEAGIRARLDKDFFLVQPGGEVASAPELVQAIEGGYGNNPDFRIAIRNVKVRRELPGHVLATYEEWQRGARASTPSDNARISTVLFQRDRDRLVWLHVHETWLPAKVMAAGPYDF